MKRKRKIRTKMFFGLLFALLILLCGEVFLRLFYVKFYHLGREATGIKDAEQFIERGVMVNALQIHPSQDWRFPYRRDRRYLWSLKPNFQHRPSYQFKVQPMQDLYINSHGCRGPEFQTTKSPETFRIVCLGDSVTFGFGIGVCREDTYPRKLESLLNRCYPHRHYEVINCGVPGYSSSQGRKWFEEEIVFWKPDVVLIGFANNDWYAVTPKTDLEIMRFNRSLFGAVAFWIDSLETYRLLRYLLIHKETKVTPDGLVDVDTAKAPRVPKPERMENYRRMVSLTHQIGGKVLLLNVCFVDDTQSATLPFLHEAATTLAVPFLDLRKCLLDVRKELFEDEQYADALRHYYKVTPGDFMPHDARRYLMCEEIHPNPLGHHILAGKIMEKLVSLNWLSRLKEVKPVQVPTPQPARRITLPEEKFYRPKFSSDK